MWKSNTINNSLMPIWFFRKILGLQNPHWTCMQKYKKCTALCKAMYSFIVLCCCLCIAYYSVFRKRDLGGSIMTKVEIYVKILARNSTMIVCVLTSIIYQAQMMQMVRFIAKIDQGLEKYSVDVGYSSVTIFIASQLLFVVLQWLVFISYKFSVCTENYFQCIFLRIVHFLPEKVGQIHIITFCAFVMVLRRQVKIVNVILENARANSVKPITMHMLLDMKKTISNVVKVSSALNSIFSLPLLIKFLQEFVKIFCTVHIRIRYTSTNSIFIQKENVFENILGSFPLYDLLLIILVCEAAYKEYTKVGNLILIINENLRDRRTQTIVNYMNEVKYNYLRIVYFR